MQLRQYQNDIIQRTHASMRAGHRKPLVVLPCGGGKTVVFAWLARQTQNGGKVVWFLVHRRELLDQTVETFKRFSIPTDSIHIGMVATVANHPHAWPDPNLIIFDEGHHAAASTWQKITAAHPDAWLIGLTATPCRLDGKPLGQIYDDLIVGVTPTDLISQGYLSPYRYFAPSVADLAGLGRKGADFDQEQASEILMQRAVYGDVIRHWRQYADGLQTICYCSSIKHSRAMAEAFRAAGILAEHFDGDTPASERRRIVQDFRERRISVLCNVDLIGEGFDVPGCWCCVLLRPTLSLSLHIQQSGRALRPQEGKTAIILDHVGNYVRHGLPDTDRTWSLTETVKAPKEFGDDGNLLVRQCHVCYYTYPAKPGPCPNCGAETKLTRKEIENVESIELQEIKKREKVDRRIEEARARSYEDFLKIEKARNYRPGWAWMRARARGYV